MIESGGHSEGMEEEKKGGICADNNKRCAGGKKSEREVQREVPVASKA